MRESSYRPIFRLALFGTYTLLAISINEVRTRLRQARVPAELKSPRRALRTRVRALRQNG